MRIESEGYILHVDDEELWDLIWALIYKLRHGIEHSARHSGMATLRMNNPKEFELLHDMCRASGRLNVYEHQIREIEDLIKEKMSELHEASN
jgi:hypothetical protein